MALTVNGEKIEEELVTKEFQRLKPHYDEVFQDQSEDEKEKQLYEWSQENVIEMVLLRQYAKENGEAVPQGAVDLAYKEMLEQYSQKPEFKDEEIAQIKSDIELQMKIERLIEQVSADVGKPTEQDILDYYNENQEQLKSQESVRVSHLVKHPGYQVDEEAAMSMIQEAHKELEKGEAFSSVVGKYSDCPDNDGDLGYIVKGQMVEEFEDVVFNLGVGQISDVFKTRFGYHIAKVYDKKPSVVPPLDEIKKQIIAQLIEQMRKDKIDVFVDGLKAKAVIEKN